MMRILWGLVLGLALQAGAPAEGWSLDALMAGLRLQRSESAHFVEIKTSRLLTRPIEARGVLNYVAPDKLEKITLTPAPETMRLDGDLLTGTRADGDEFSVDIGSHGEIAALVEGIRSTLAGDLPTLRRYYEIAFTGDPGHWQIDLEPKDGGVREKVERIRILGAGTKIGGIDIFETDGDHSEMTITPDTAP